MSDITTLVESIRDGELSVVAQKLLDMQATITAALETVATLQLEVEGTGLIPPTSESAVGVIHSPSRATNILPSKEMFIGQYFVGDLLAPSATNPAAKVGVFYFGAASPCFFYFNPTDPNHGVNKHYVDQVATPLNIALANTISRTGDQCPTAPPNLIPNQFIFTGSDAHKATWLIDGPQSTGPTGAVTDFAASVALNNSAFFLNIDDFRWYGMVPTVPEHLITKGFADEYYLQTVNTGKSATFTGGTFVWDATATLSWNDTQTTADKATNFPHELATMKNVADLIAAIPGGASAPAVSGASFSLSGDNNATGSSLDFSSAIPFGEMVSSSGTPYFDRTSSILWTCTRACTLLINVSLMMQGTNDGGGNGWIYTYIFHVKKNGSDSKTITNYYKDLGGATGYEYASTSDMTVIPFAIGDTLSFDGAITQYVVADSESCSVTMIVLH